MSDRLEITLETGDVLEAAADVVLLKHAQAFYGADEAVAARLIARAGAAKKTLSVAPGSSVFVDTNSTVRAPLALFVGTPPLANLGYHEIRVLAERALAALESRPDVRHLACTVHGTAFGLDEDEAVLALAGGFIEAFQRGSGPQALERISLVELNAGRMKRMRAALERGLGASPKVTPLVNGWGFAVARSTGFVQPPAMATAGANSAAKPHAFVAMPFVPEMEDVYHYGILGPVRGANLLCERVDQAIFDGLIVQRIRDRIDSAKVVIADLSFGNPNVYLEVGYAWGRNKPTILLVRDIKELKFDVAASRCLVYGSIRDLEKMLTTELSHLK
jgi:hypothetical protein